MMTGQAWLTYPLALLMLATAAYCAGRLIAARRWHRRTDRAVDTAHVLTGVAMAGMLVPALDPLGAAAWTVVFALTTASFAVRAVLPLGPAVAVAVHRYPTGRAPGRHLQHLVLSGAMLYMYLALPSHGGMPGMTGSGLDAPAGPRYPAVGLLLILLLVAYAASTLDHALPSPARPGAPTVRGLAPRAADCCDVLMSVSMVYLLILVL